MGPHAPLSPSLPPKILSRYAVPWLSRATVWEPWLRSPQPLPGSHASLCSLLSWYHSANLFFTFCYWSAMSKYGSPVCLPLCSVVTHPYSCSLLYPSNLLGGPEKNAAFVEVRCKIPVYIHGYQDSSFVLPWILVGTIQNTIPTQTYAIYEYGHYACKKILLQSNFENNTIVMLNDISYIGSWFWKIHYTHKEMFVLT